MKNEYFEKKKKELCEIVSNSNEFTTLKNVCQKDPDLLTQLYFAHRQNERFLTDKELLISIEQIIESDIDY